MEQEILWKLAGTGDPGTDAGNTTDVEEAWSVDEGISMMMAQETVRQLGDPPCWSSCLLLCQIARKHRQEHEYRRKKSLLWLIWGCTGS